VPKNNDARRNAKVKIFEAANSIGPLGLPKPIRAFKAFFNIRIKKNLSTLLFPSYLNTLSE